MKQSKTTRKALLTSILAMVLCLAMLMGTTFAWFTDSAATAVNTIQAGTLDIQLLDAEGNSVEGKTLNWKTADGRAQDKILWEPGCTYELQPVTIRNNGNLALKYKIAITGIGGDAELNEVINWTIQVDGVDENLTTYEGKLTAGSTATLNIKGHMEETAGNQYQGKSINDVSITVVATQDTVEYDSEDNQYDLNAEYPVQGDYNVNDAADLATALTEAKDGEVIALASGTYVLDGGADGNSDDLDLDREADIQIIGNSGTTLVVSSDSYWPGCTVTAKNITFKATDSFTTNAGSYSGSGYKSLFIAHDDASGAACDLYFENCVFDTSDAEGISAIHFCGSATFVNCQFIGNGNAFNYCCGGGASQPCNVVVDGCTFSGYTGATISLNEGNFASLTVKNTTIESGCVELGSPVTVTFDNNTLNCQINVWGENACTFTNNVFGENALIYVNPSNGGSAADDGGNTFAEGKSWDSINTTEYPS